MERAYSTTNYGNNWISQDLHFSHQNNFRQKDVARYITGTLSNEDTSRPGMDTIMADSNETGRRIQIKTDNEDKCMKITEITHPQGQPIGLRFNMQMIQVPEHALDKFVQLLNKIRNAQLDQDQNTSGHLLMIRTRHDDWKAKATISLVKTTQWVKKSN